MQPDPALGIPVAFDSTPVRNGLLFAMQMGAPSATRKVVFLQRSGTVSYYRGDTLLDLASFKRDRDGKPLDPTIRMEVAADTEIPVDCAIEVTEVRPDELPTGNFKPSKATLTLMEPEYQQVVGCKQIRYNEDHYQFSHEPEATGLFDMQFHTLVFYALDES